MTFVKPTTCRRCKGTGLVARNVVYAGAPGGCFSCAGHGVVEGDRATIAPAKARREARIAMATELVDGAVSRGMERHVAICLAHAVDHLATNAPARYDAALDAFLAGTPGLFPALIAYAADNGFLRYGTTPLTATEALARLS